MRAAYYRELAETATTTAVRDGLLRLAQQCEAAAAERPG